MMKLVIDERVKHRLIGLAVILSIGAIFAPAIMKKSNQRLDGNVSVSVELPSKPLHPDIVMVEKNAMFETAKVAHVELPDVSDEKPHTTVAKAEPLSQMNRIESINSVEQPVTVNLDKDVPRLEKEEATLVVNTTKVATVKKIAKAAAFPPQSSRSIVLAKNDKSSVKIVKATSKPIPRTIFKNGYAVQLATFTQLRNASYLISKLKKKGYTATYNKVKTREGTVYKVLVGQMNKREQAELLQRQLVSAVQIRGFIVTTGQG